ncbi:MAG: phthalate 3,4-dioxygenase alpha subunit [Gammaproteobacteria bacterium]|jgi:phthalate 3,4-dioxygenase alpha subunit
MTVQSGEPVGACSEIISNVRQGLVPAHVYNDDEVFALERDRLFSRAWVFLAHESEIANPNDFVVRNILADSFLITRDANGQVHVMFNMCVHRGMQVCRAERGSAKMFRCPYHAWTYKNDGTLAGLPFHADAYGGEEGFVKSGQALLPVPSMTIYNGLIFASLDENAPDFLTWLGDYRFYLDFFTKQSEAGMEFRGPQRWRIKANWKIGAENFCGDSYHTPHTHASVVDIKLFGDPKPNKRKEGVLWYAGPGGGTTYKLPPDSGYRGGLGYVGYPEEMIDRMSAVWSAEQRSMLEEPGFMPSATTLFPNLSFVHNWPQVNSEGRIRPFISARLWQPIGPGETEVLSWSVVAADAPEEFKRESYKAYLLCFGSSGMFEQDDVENWVSITTTAGGSMARRLLLNNRMGLNHQGEPIKPQYPGFAGPGTAYQGFGEYNQRHWFNHWAEFVERAPDRSIPVAFGVREGAS